MESRHRALRVVAPAGSGKTETIVARIRRRLADGFEPGRLLVLTFDTSAARSLRERLEVLTGAPTGGPRISTLNAFGFALIREHAPHEYRHVVSHAAALSAIGEELEILKRKDHRLHCLLTSNAAERGLALVALLKNDLVDPRRTPLERVCRHLLRSPQAAAILPEDPTQRRIAIDLYAWLFGAYERHLRRRNRMDFDDQKLRAWALLETSRSLRERVRSRYGEIIVDEFQDINRLDFELVKTIATRASLMVAGDDDQAIYGFRGCTSDYILELDRHLGRPVQSRELRTNYRNPPNLVRIANRLIRHNPRRIPKHPIAGRHDEAVVEVRPAASRDSEAKGIAAAARRILTRPEGGTVAVLYRLNAQSLPLQVALRDAGVPYEVRAEDDLRCSLDDPATTDRPPPVLARWSPGGCKRRVELRTYFRAKGLQWDVVFLPGCNAGLMPYVRAAIEDERRLFYVALTRASKRLVVSYVLPQSADGGPPSPFLEEAGLVDAGLALTGVGG